MVKFIIINFSGKLNCNSGSNIDAKKLKSWMKRNNWNFERANSHELWIYINEESITINFHRNKGLGIAEDALSDISKTMGLTKRELIKKIRNNKN